MISNENSSSDNHKTKSFFIRNIVIILLIIAIFLSGALFSVAIISITNITAISEIPEEDYGSEPNQAITENKDNENGLAELMADRNDTVATLATFDQAVSQIAKQISPSIVSIKVKIQSKDFFGNTLEQEGLGSGVIYSSDGYIITNNHLVGEATALTVTLSDDSQYPAILVGADTDTDIAVIKIDESNLSAAEFSSIENVEVGEIAIAIGSPFGLEQTVTMGVVSAKGRDITISADTLPMVDLIQTDASINQGNSGGSLVNSSGEVIGINTLILSSTGTSSGVGFAIPSDTAINIAGQIIRYGEAKIPIIGIEMGENKTEVKGVIVHKVSKGYPAEKAGIREGDVITEFDGKIVETPYQLLAQILRHNVGDDVILKVYRDGSLLSINVALSDKSAFQN